MQNYNNYLFTQYISLLNISLKLVFNSVPSKVSIVELPLIIKGSSYNANV